MASKLTPPGSPYLRPLEPESPPPDFARDYTSHVVLDYLAEKVAGFFSGWWNRKEDPKPRSPEESPLLGRADPIEKKTTKAD